MHTDRLIEGVTQRDAIVQAITEIGTIDLTLPENEKRNIKTYKQYITWWFLKDLEVLDAVEVGPLVREAVHLNTDSAIAYMESQGTVVYRIKYPGSHLVAILTLDPDYENAVEREYLKHVKEARKVIERKEAKIEKLPGDKVARIENYRGDIKKALVSPDDDSDLETATVDDEDGKPMFRHKKRNSELPEGD